MGKVRLAPEERKMSILLIAVKTMMLIALSAAIFAGVAYALGVDPLAAKSASSCVATTTPACLFRIF